jgi:hypothetical protein
MTNRLYRSGDNAAMLVQKNHPLQALNSFHVVARAEHLLRIADSGDVLRRAGRSAVGQRCTQICAGWRQQHCFDR